MALPIVHGTWSYLVNQISLGKPTALAQNKELWFNVKQALIGQGAFTARSGDPVVGPPAGAMTVVGSSNSSTAGMDGVDRWASAANLVWHGTTRSWIVLRHAGIGIELLIDFNTTTTSQGTLRLAYPGFGSAYGGTDGSISAAPTAPGDTSITLVNANVVGGTTTTNISTIFNVLLSTNSVRLLMCRGSQVVHITLIEKVFNPVNNWSSPFFVTFKGVISTAPAGKLLSTSDISSPDSALGRSLGSDLMTAAMTCEGFSNNTVNETVTGPNSFTGEYQLLPIRLASNTAGNIGSHGDFQDIWLTSRTLPTGSTFPVTPAATREFALFDNFIVPWNGSVPLITL